MPSWGNTHQALQTPIPYTLDVPTTIPPHARLRVSLALRDDFLGQKLVDVTDSTRFVVTFVPDGGGAPVVLLDRVLDPRGTPGDRRWRRFDVDVARVAGATGTVRFRAERADAPGEAARTFALWGRPTVYDAEAQRSRPNVLLLTIDALRADHLSAWGYGRPTSPHLDRLAAEGVRWANAFSNAPMTMPSLAQLFSGRWFPDENSPTILTSLFADGIPATHAIVRNPYLQSYLQLDARDTFDRQVALDFWRADKMTRAALEWIDAQRGDRWALWVHYLDTHTPYRTPAAEALHFADPAYRGPIGPGFGDVEGARSGIYDAADRRHIVDLYDGAIRWTDAQVGVLLDGLRQRGLLDRTVVVVTADHGEELFDHGSFFHGISLYDEQLHVPLIARFPGGAHGGTVVDAQVSLVDVAPTIADAAQAPVEPGFQGRSLVAGLRGESAPPRPVFARAANPTFPWRFALRTPTHKLITTVDPHEEQLFDLVADPQERTNRVDDPAMAPVLQRLREGLATFRAPLADTGVQLRAVAPRGLSSVLEVKVTALAGNQPLANPDRVGAFAGDRITLTPDGRTLTWLVRVPDTPVGIRFDRGVLPTWRGDVQIEFAARALGAMDLAPRAIFLGADGVHPAADPFTYTVKPGSLFGKPVEDPPLAASRPPATLEAFVGEPATLYAWRAGGPIGTAAPAPAPAPGVDDEQRRKLRALGYAE
jgi:arylsulfatase